jgi:hypothetical protein
MILAPNRISNSRLIITSETIQLRTNPSTPSDHSILYGAVPFVWIQQISDPVGFVTTVVICRRYYTQSQYNNLDQHEHTSCIVTIKWNIPELPQCILLSAAQTIQRIQPCTNNLTRTSYTKRQLIITRQTGYNFNTSIAIIRTCKCSAMSPKMAAAIILGTAIRQKLARIVQVQWLFFSSFEYLET